MSLPGVVATPASCMTRLRRRLVAHRGDHVGVGADERQAVIGADLAQSARSRPESRSPGWIASQPQISAGRNDVRDVEVGARRPGPGPTQNASSAWRTCSDSRSASVKIATVAHAELVAGAVDAQRDLAAIGDQDLCENGLRPTRSIAKSGWPYSTGWPSAHVDRSDAPRPARAHRIADAEGFDVGQLAVGLEQIALRRRRPAQGGRSRRGPARIASAEPAARPALARSCGIVADQRRDASGAPPEFDLFAVALDPQPLRDRLSNSSARRADGRATGRRWECSSDIER